ncbi:MAG: 1-(5-phosphoribosyl)-5-[(5-phosphoribosylamino)methylideneamino]imidazole-4-carboxamide isomerase [Rhodospirillales bacterium]|nr:1-(5-phosphoribosyl)-5-[(5-phosphoribosylamino)methylideneamino]imidazole-4-carboxamide isomerase [Alphaproteobacteria bacterium]USO04083.1 MAG: 1-(5-phosphoribosyl)-5-[(5-phosphoribosylamino)methylideneamino]imidazole-4-carboxamide isomerase [Rhodospirillales bacterium]
MIIYPAIDLKDGKCVRLYKGEMDQDTVYNDDPAAQALTWARAGFSWLHVVDLNGAFEGKSVNADAVTGILASTDLPVQLGGGIRSLKQIEHWLAQGVSRVILGTTAVRDPGLVQQACALFPGQIAVGIDARKGLVAVEGWAEASDITAIDLAQKFEDCGVETIIYTDIDRDGTGEGLNMDSTRQLAQNTKIPVIASGGVGSLEDVRAVRAAESTGIEGVIIGKALYDGRIDAAEALKL